MVLKENFCELSVNELTDTSGGMAPAVFYAAGFALGTSPLVAVTIVVGVAAAGVTLAKKSSKKNNAEGRAF